MKKYFVILTVLSVMALSACKKQLEEKAFSFLTENNFYQNATDAQSALIGVFNAFQAQTHYQRTVWLITELPGEAFVPTSLEDRLQLHNMNVTPSNAEITSWWNRSYFMINRANDLIKNVPAIKMNEAQKNHIVGAARFLRALGYFDLVRSYGDVPLLLRPVEGASDSLLFPSRTPAAEVYKAIIADLQYAESNCYTKAQLTGNDKGGMVTSHAASALLAKVYLQRGSMPFAEGDDNNKALAQCDKVLAVTGGNGYGLFPNFPDVFSVANENGTEHIFSIQFGPIVTGITSNIVIRMVYPAAMGGAGSFVSTNKFFNEGFAAEDLRRNHTLAKGGTGTNGQPFTVNTPFVFKYREPNYVANSNNSNINWIVLRLADVWLMRSEAINNIDPNDNRKYDGVDTLRHRAGLTLPTQKLRGLVLGKEQFIDSLVKDRYRELFMEGHRRFDLMRLKRFKQMREAAGLPYVATQEWLPIPQNERDANKNLTQNDGYPK